MSSEKASNSPGLCPVNPLNAKLNPTSHLLALLGAHHILHVSRIGVKGQKPSLDTQTGSWNELSSLSLYISVLLEGIYVVGLHENF